VGRELERLDTKGLGLRMQAAGINAEQLSGIIDQIPMELFYNPGMLLDLPN